MAEQRFEWPTWAMLGLTYLVWGIGTTWAAELWLPLGMAMVMLGAAQHSSLTHEALHGHPTRYARVNEALVIPALSLLIPYARFRDLHLAHHNDSILTDPYDDPESNYLDPAVWAVQPPPATNTVAPPSTGPLAGATPTTPKSSRSAS